ncbi:uracil-DNA glycosylase [Bacillus methanolicus]|uniref:uracil-DNA glycosylase n=1 Tax=Bacillus methanolicus TaxID=1471 RepID=UPI002380B187|nr:uracil-DNA glycosylase [Bacillus methanolicus]MDE3840376.1 uracil-DNA glycosylase [Bacillus methanolicus]
MEKRKINCVKCSHFYVTWDPNFPRGCKAFQFKTRNLPSVEVFRASGRACLKYERKE